MASLALANVSGSASSEPDTSSASLGVALAQTTAQVAYTPKPSVGSETRQVLVWARARPRTNSRPLLRRTTAALALAGAGGGAGGDVIGGLSGGIDGSIGGGIGGGTNMV